jgi:hypothetical protein
VVWFDSNVLLLDGVDELLANFKTSGLPMGAFIHPIRKTTTQEAAACMESKRVEVFSEMVNAVQQLGPDPGVGLWENNVVFFDLQNPLLAPLLAKWWSFIEGGTHRDQISLPHAVTESGAAIFELLPQGKSSRNDDRFGLLPHKNNEFDEAFSKLMLLAP